jgi:hypothetical protein
MNLSETLQSELDRVQQRALILGSVTLAPCVAAAFALHSLPAFMRSYLIGFLFWLGIALGCLAVLMMQHLTGGQWGLVIRRILESGAGTLPVTYLLFIPVALGLHELYGWSRPAGIEGTNQTYLNVPFFFARTAFYFLAWFLLAYYLIKWSEEQDQTGDPTLLNRFQSISGAGLVLYGLTITFASVDWVMSLEPHWRSTMYGILYMTEEGLAAFAFSITVLALLAHHKPFAGFVGSSHFHDLGTLTFAFIMLWAYVSFSQFLIIWAGNLLEEIPWYLRRFSHGWIWVGLALFVFLFALPFLLLLQRSIKRNMRAVATVAIGLLVMRLVNLFWAVLPAPTRHSDVGGFSWMDIVAPVGIGGIWVAIFIRQLKRRPLLPLNDPRLKQQPAHHG